MIFLGDTHGIRPIFNIIDKNKIENCNIIHVGDLGLGFERIDRDLKNLEVLQEMLEETGNKLYVCRGNHDNPIFWKKDLGLNLPKYHNIFLVEDYSILTIEGKKVFFLGGGISIDRTIRRDDHPYPTWWKGEELVYDALNPNLMEHIDIVVTHSAPMFATPKTLNASIVNDWAKVEEKHGMNLKSDLKEERQNLSYIANEIFRYSKPTHWFYGHFHMSYKEKIQRTEFVALSINELKELI